MMQTKTFEDFKNMLDKEGLLVYDNSSLTDFDVDISDISYNSKEVKQGTLFIAKGIHFKKEYLTEAVKSGAVAYICEQNSSKSSDPVTDIPYIIVNDMRKSMSEVGRMFFDEIWNDKLEMIGLTGTKGKSTTATFIKTIMDEYCHSINMPEIGFLSGIYNYDGKDRKPSEKMTTLETLELHHHLKRCVDNGLKYLVMETSSQALKYKRTEALNYKVCAFLNVSEDHISDREHPTFEDYFNSKLLIFRQSEYACINHEMDDSLFTVVSNEASKYCQKVYTFGRDERADYYGFDVVSSPDELSFKLKHPEGQEEIKVSIGGYFNAANALAAIAVTRCFGVPMEIIKSALLKVRVPGRMELYHFQNKNVDVIVDYAHNRLSYETLFENLDKLYPGRKKLLVFGVHGNKAYNRKKDLGEMAQKFADMVILTEQDIGTDDLNKIWHDILDHLDENKVESKISNRKEAILHACEIVPEGWIMAICGNGADKFQKRGLICVPEPTDGEIVQSYIDNHNR